MMPITGDPVGIAYLVTGLALLAFFRKPLRQPDRQGSRLFAAALLGCVLWPVSLGASYLVDLHWVTVAAAGTRLLAASIVSVSWFLLAVEVTRSRSPSRGLTAVLAGYVATGVLVVATNGVHQLAIHPESLATGAPLESAWGPWFWIQASVNYGLIAAATLLLAMQAIPSSGLRRTQAAALSLATVPPLLANVVTVAGLVDVGHDLTPFGLIGSGVILSWALYRAEFLDVVPVARQTALDEIHDAVVTLDHERRVVDCNAVARRLFDVPDDYFGRPFRSAFSSLPTDLIDAVEAESSTDTEFSIEIDGDQREIACSTSPVGPDGAVTSGTVVVFWDVTERKRNERRLVQQNETLEEFASIVSHDVQGPLMEIRGSADLAAAQDDVSQMEHVLDAADRMDRLVEDLHELARSGQRIERTEPVELADVAGSAWGTTWKGDATLDVRDDVSLLADSDRIRQLLENLFRNAVEHGSTGPGSQARQDAVEHGSTSPHSQARQDSIEHGTADVRVTVGALDDGFYVEDDGPGIPQEDRESVFDRGYTTAESGTGLGLVIVEEIARAHGWAVGVDGGTDGGARFEVTGIERP